MKILMAGGDGDIGCYLARLLLDRASGQITRYLAVSSFLGRKSSSFRGTKKRSPTVAGPDSLPRGGQK